MIIKHNNSVVIDTQVEDESYRYRAIMGEDALTINFKSAEYIDIPVGSYVDYNGERYALETPEDFTKNGSRHYEYKLVLHSAAYKSRKYKFINVADGSLKFSLVAKPSEYLSLIVANMNRRDTGWSVGSYIEATETLLSFNHNTVYEALQAVAQAFETEWQIVGKTISLGKVEYNKADPLPLSYGKGNGFVPGVGRTRYDQGDVVDVLYVQGGERNIDYSKYGSRELLLPKNAQIGFDGDKFEGESGYNSASAKIYVTDGSGLFVKEFNAPTSDCVEGSLDCSDIYPTKEHTILQVIEVNVEKHWYDIVFDAVESLDYRSYQIGGEKPTVIFQDGMLAGREFDIETDKEGTIKAEKVFNGSTFVGWKVQLVPQDIDGITMPNVSKGFAPQTNNHFKVFGIQLPDDYICQNANKSGASWDMMRKAVRYLHENSTFRFSFTGTLDAIYSRAHWEEIGSKIKIGGYILFSDTQFLEQGEKIRITGVKEYINNPYKPEIELSNVVGNGGGLSSELRRLDAQEVVIENKHKEAIFFSKRRYRDAIETMGMLESAMLDFDGAIKPVAVKTMQALVGDESLQFRFVTSNINPEDDPYFYLNFTNGTLNVGSYYHSSHCILQHLTLGIDSLKSSHEFSEYRFWSIPNREISLISGTSYYLYARVLQEGDTGEFVQSPNPISMNTGSYYYLLVAIINKDVNGDRSIAPMFGFTEILPGRITTDKIVSNSGNVFLDLVASRLTLGDENNHLRYSPDEGLRLKGVLNVSPSGDAFPNICWRGDWNAATSYYYGDGVSYNGQSYLYINGTAAAQGQTNKNPESSTGYWQLTAGRGSNAKSVEISYTSQVFKYELAEGELAPNPTEITLTAKEVNFSATSRKWQYYNGTTWALIANSDSLTINISPNSGSYFTNENVRARTFRYVATFEGVDYTDEVTIAKLVDGAKGEDAYTVLLTNESASVTCDAQGGVITGGGAVMPSTSILVYKGTEQIMARITKVGTTNVSGDGDFGGLNILNNTGAVLSPTAQVLASALTEINNAFILTIAADEQTFTKTFSVNKTLSGNQGTTGISPRYSKWEAWSGSGSRRKYYSGELSAENPNRIKDFVNLVINGNVVAYECLITHEAQATFSEYSGDNRIWGEIDYLPMVATEVLLASKAAINNLYVEELRTHQNAEDQIYINDNTMSVNNSSGQQTLLVHGGNLSSGSVSSKSFSSQSHTSSHTSGANRVRSTRTLISAFNTGRISQYILTTTISAEADIVEPVQPDPLPSNPGSPSGAELISVALGEITTTLILDGVRIASVSSTGASSYKQINLAGTLSIGSHILEVEFSYAYFLLSGGRCDFSASVNAGSLELRTSERMTEIAGNGMRTQFASNQQFLARVDGGNFTLLMQNGNALMEVQPYSGTNNSNGGIRISDNGGSTKRYAVAADVIKRIEVVQSYPNAEDPNVLYIKTS